MIQFGEGDLSVNDLLTNVAVRSEISTETSKYGQVMAEAGMAGGQAPSPAEAKMLSDISGLLTWLDNLHYRSFDEGLSAARAHRAQGFR